LTAGEHYTSAFAIRPYAFLFFDPRGRPGPRRPLRRRRPFFGFVLAVETLPSNDWIAERTSCCTRARITVNKLLCLGIESSFAAADTRMADHQQKAVRQASQCQEKHAGGLLMAKAPGDGAGPLRRLDGAHLLPLVRADIAFVDGVPQQGKASKARARNPADAPPTSQKQVTAPPQERTA
jgi:hypothetical protein